MVGETGSGKSTPALCRAGLIQPPVASGSVRLDGTELIGAPAEELRQLRWRRVALALQGAPFNPVVRVGDQIAGPVEPDAGEVRLEGSTMVSSWRREARTMRRRIQLVMQDPWDALSPRLTVEEMVREPLDLDRDGAHLNDSAEVAEALESVGLPSSGSFLRAHTHELSGGQLQRIALARALIVRPKLLVTDEPTSMLDASEQARLLVALRERQVEMGLGLVLISTTWRLSGK